MDLAGFANDDALGRQVQLDLAPGDVGNLPGLRRRGEGRKPVPQDA